MGLNVCINHRGQGSTKVAKNGHTLTFDLFKARSSLLPYAFVWEKVFKNLILQNQGWLVAESLHISSGMGGLPKLLKQLSYIDM